MVYVTEWSFTFRNFMSPTFFACFLFLDILYILSAVTSFCFHSYFSFPPDRKIFWPFFMKDVFVTTYEESFLLLTFLRNDPWIKSEVTKLKASGTKYFTGISFVRPSNVLCPRSENLHAMENVYEEKKHQQLLECARVERKANDMMLGSTESLRPRVLHN